MTRTTSKPKTSPAPAPAKLPEVALAWRDIREFGVEGKGWTDTEHFYDRLPARAKDLVPPAVWKLSQNSTGLCARFATDADQIHARWTLRSATLAMPHMPATSVSGLDLYVRVGREWRSVGQGRPEKFPTNTARLVSEIAPARRREYLLYLPLYNGVESVEIGVPRGREIGPLAGGMPLSVRGRGHGAAPACPSAKTRKGMAPGQGARSESSTRAICFYGTSITQGGCASRPGMAYTAILGRRLNRPVINLGFSGNGRAEPSVATLLAELDPAVFVIDCIPNVDSPRKVRENVGGMVRALRASRPRTPIILVESIRFARPPFVTGLRRNWGRKNAMLRRVFRSLRAEGLRGLHYVSAEGLLGDDGDATVDGVHPTDLGFLRMADAIAPALKKAIGNRR